jgi:hypothetical protein
MMRQRSCFLRISCSCWILIILSVSVSTSAKNEPETTAEQGRRGLHHLRRHLLLSSETTEPDLPYQVTKGPLVQYTGQVDSACRLEDGSRGQEGQDYIRLESSSDLMTLEACIDQCSSNNISTTASSGLCYGYEFKSERPSGDVDKITGKAKMKKPACRLWTTPIGSLRTNKPDHYCFRKTEMESNGDSAITKTNITCPEPEDGGFCPLNYAPVSCGEELQCIYSNRCFAQLAGYNETSDCIRAPSLAMDEDDNVTKVVIVKKSLFSVTAIQASISLDSNNTDAEDFTCPEPKDGGFCPLVYAPVRCGGRDEQCKYSNSCFAQLAGYNNSGDCVPSDGTSTSGNNGDGDALCEIPDPGAVCILVYQPVVCSNDGDSASSLCDYSNQCFADLAGYNNTVCNEKCLTHQQGSLFDNVDTWINSNNISSSSMCGLHNAYNPVMCGGTTGCTFENVCLAQYRGNVLQAKEECQMYCPSVVSAAIGETSGVETQARALPPVGSGTASPEPLDCDAILMAPVICGLNKCEYDSLCVATAGAGYDEDQCTPVPGSESENDGGDGQEVVPKEEDEENCKREFPTQAKCDKTRKQVRCIDRAEEEICIYPNMCLAEAAEWEPAACTHI